MNAPQVSIIVPVYNGATTVAEAVASIRAQEVPAEVIIVDDGSTDDTPRILESFGVTSVRQENAGPAAARNRGLALVRTAFVGFLDDDDVWLPHKLRDQLRLFEEHPGAAIVLGHTAFQSLDAASGRWDSVAEPHLLYHLGAALCRREAFDRIGPFDPNLHSSEDVDWFLRARDAGLRIVVSPDTVQLHRRNGENMTRGKDLRELGFIEVLKRSLDRRRAGAAQP
jgi:glycosyltransferase involved in cell wall biosynthesis